jgi:hypothetical protein
MPPDQRHHPAHDSEWLHELKHDGFRLHEPTPFRRSMSPSRRKQTAADPDGNSEEFAWLATSSISMSTASTPSTKKALYSRTTMRQLRELPMRRVSLRGGPFRRAA